MHRKIVDGVQERVEEIFDMHISKHHISKTLDAFVDYIAQEAEDGITIRGFGRFLIKERKGGTIKSNRGHISYPNKKVLTFKCSKMLKEELNK